MKSPFNDKFFGNVLSSLDALDQAAEKQAHDKQYTADGVLLEKGLKVWCVDLPFGKTPWELWYGKNGSWFMTKRNGQKRDAYYTVVYADKTRAVFARKNKIVAEILKIDDEYISSRRKELEELEKI